MSGPRPPLLARWVLRLRLPRALHEAFAGDLEERFQASVVEDPDGARRAFWRDVLSPTVRRFRSESRGMPLPPGAPPAPGLGDGAVHTILSDLRFAIRTLRKAPAFTSIAVLSLALGIGPNTAIFSLVDAVLFQDWGVDDPERIVDVYTLSSSGEFFFSRYETFELLEESTGEVFESLAQHSLFAGRLEGPGDEAELVLGEMVSGNYFDVMGVTAAHGRTFVPEEDATEGTHPVVVLGHHYWTSRFAADPGTVGGEIRLNGRPYTVIGIAPEAFKGRLAPGIGTDFWVPFRMFPHLNPGKMGNGDLTITGRLRPGIQADRAVATVETVASRRDAELQRENPDRQSRFELAAVSLADVRLHPNFDGILTQMAILLFAAVGLVLLVACINLAGFLLSRASDRRKEMAIRIAMGAGRRGIVRQLLVESLVLAGLGAGAGLVLGQIAIRALAAIELPIPVPVELEVGLSAPLLIFTVGVAVLASLLFGLTPALEAMRAPAASTLRDEAGTSGGKGKVRARGALVTAQMALSTMLLVGAALFVRSLQSASNLDLGFSTRDAAVVDIDTGANEYSTDERVAFIDALQRRVEATPGVAQMAITGRMPLDLGVQNTAFDVPGVEPPPGQNRHVLETAAIGPGYLEALGIDLLEGRTFRESDGDGAPPVAILSQAAASRLWPGESAVGRLLIRDPDGSDALTVVGVVGNAKIWSLGEAPFPYMYRPYFQGLQNATFSVVATGAAEPEVLAGIIRSEARAIDPEIFLTSVGTMDDHLGYAFFLPRTVAIVLSLVGALALFLACMGLHGMVSYGVSRRTREMGIRLALGADRAAVSTMILRGGLRFVAVGAMVGILGAIALGRAADRFLYGAAGLDAIAMIGGPILLAGVAILSAWLPARRAARVDPVQALRYE